MMKNIAAFLFSLLTVSFTAQAQWIQLGQSINAEVIGDKFGRSVSINSDGSVVVIGAPNNDEAGEDAGFVRIFQNVNGDWEQIGNSIYGESPGDRFGFSTDITADGSVVAIGAPFNDETGEDAGYVRVFQNVNGTWTQIGNTIEGVADNEKAGFSVQISSDGSVVAFGAQISYYNHHVRIYQNLNDTWTQIGNDINGATVSLNADGSVAAIGNPNLNYGGHVFVYQNLDGEWVQVGQTLDNEYGWGFYGAAVSLNSDGSILATGGPYIGGPRWSGRVLVFQNINGSWIQEGQDIVGEEEGDLSGIAVSLSADGSIVAIGAPAYDITTGDGFGNVRVFQYQEESWSQIGQTIKGKKYKDAIGVSVDLSADGSVLAFGVPNYDTNEDIGYVKVFTNDSVVGVTELSGSKLEVYPNPTNGIVNLKYTGNKTIQVSVYDAAGRIVFNQQLPAVNNQNQVDLSGLKNGIYLIKIQVDDHLFTSRIVKK